MSWSTAKGFNFRATAAFVGDGSNEQYVNSTLDVQSGAGVVYPTPNTIGGDLVTYGWVAQGGSTTGTRDRNNALGADFAGTHFNENHNTDDFQIDLPASGSYTIRLAAGDPNGSQPTKVVLYDGTSDPSPTTLCNGTTGGADAFFDAVGGGPYSHTTWPGSNTAVTKTFTGTTCIVRIGNGAATATGFIAHLQIAQNAGTPSSGVVVVRTVPGGTGGAMTVTRTAP